MPPKLRMSESFNKKPDEYKITLEGGLSGSLIENQKVEKNIEYLNGLRDLKNKYGTTWAGLIGGNSKLSHGGYALNSSFLKEKGFDFIQNKKSKLAIGSLASAWNTGCDVNTLANDPTQEYRRYKFYSSLDLSTKEKEKKAQDFFLELFNEVKKQKLSIQTKTQDHTYDSFNVYTWHPNEMLKIFKNLYPKYRDIWLDTEHFFQGKIEGVSDKHIGYVQEPLAGALGGGDSHSGRMFKLGKYLDSHEGLDFKEMYVNACKEAKVKPSAPYLLDI